MTELLLSVAIVVVVSATCSLFEAILYAVPVSHIETLVQGGRKSGRILQKLRRDVDKPIAAILSLNTIANTAGAAVAGALAAEQLGHAWIPWFSAGFTLLILIFSEILPKTTGVVHSKGLSAVIARPLELLVYLMHPLVWLSRHVTGLISGGSVEHRMSEDELLVMIRLSGQTGILREDEVQAMTNILALKAKTVREVMTPRVVVFSRSCELTVGDLRDEAGTWTHGRVPVFDQDDEDIVGIVHRRNVLAAIGQDQFDIKLSELMIPAHFVQQSFTLDRLLRLFLEKRMQMVVVLGEYGDLAGIVTLEDVLESLLGKEIVDEFDKVENMRELAHRRRDELLRGRRRARRPERGPEPPR